MVPLITPLSAIKGIAPKFLTHLSKLHITTVHDLLSHFPTRYEDFSRIVKIADLEVNQVATIQCVIKKISLRRSFRRRLFLIEAVASDDTGDISAIWFNQPYLTSIIRPGKLMNLAGKVIISNDNMCLSSPMYEFVGKKESVTRHTARLTPIYPETKGLTSKAFRYLVKPLLDHAEKIPEWIPTPILETQALPEVNHALHTIHFPENLEEVENARKRFAFEDLFLLQLVNVKNRLLLTKEKAPRLTHEIIQKTHKNIALLPFTLTPSQEKVLQEIYEDLKKGTPMNRLLQGDVGSGKTVIAALAALPHTEKNYQVAFMAPTEILARQHYSTLKRLFPHLECGIGLMTGSEHVIYYGPHLESKTTKNSIIDLIDKAKIKIIIGTHAIIEDAVSFPRLGLLVIDEQHRFGVKQRALLLKSKAHGSEIPHLLSMSATPIPRTLSLSVFGDLDISIINELPKGRQPILTKVVPPIHRAKAYQFIRSQIKKGRQAFVICPRITAPEENNDSKILALDTKNVTEEYEKLSKEVFPDLSISMLHGKMKPREKENIMKDFSSKKIDILVSTSVIEVGIDIPNATIMMIEGAERFGLAQLYQFRGRVGRGKERSFCFLFTDSTAKSTEDRLKALLEAKNGFELAEKDLEIRGPGEFLGQKQTGLPDIAMNALRNMDLVKSARKDAEDILKKVSQLIHHPLLLDRLRSFEEKIHKE